MPRQCRYCGGSTCRCTHIMKKSNHQIAIEQFMLKAQQDVPPKPTIPSRDVMFLRARLILEESLETIRALGFDVYLDPETMDYGLLDTNDFNLIKVVDGCADISVVTIGTLSAFGIADGPILDAIDESNLAKFGKGSYRREDGKWIKPPGWKAPDLKRLLVDQGLDEKDEDE